jgi:hypothetical protein
MRLYQEVVIALINEDHIIKALDYAVEHDVHSIKLK